MKDFDYDYDALIAAATAAARTCLGTPVPVLVELYAAGRAVNTAEAVHIQRMVQEVSPDPGAALAALAAEAGHCRTLAEDPRMPQAPREALLALAALLEAVEAG